MLGSDNGPEAAGDSYARLAIGDIQFDDSERQRTELDVENLIESVARIGILNPLLVRQDNDGSVWLVAGRRRLECARRLGHESVPIRYLHELSQIEQQIVELEENVRRQDLPWRDHVGSIGRIHELYESMDPEWTQQKTADSLGFQKHHTSKLLRVWRDLENPALAKATSYNEAYNALTRWDERRKGELAQELLDHAEQTTGLPGDLLLPAVAAPGQPPLASNPFGSGLFNPLVDVPRAIRALAPEAIICTDFAKWAQGYTGAKFNLIHCDFPYGIGVFGGDQFAGPDGTDGGAYDDSAGIYFALLETLIAALPKIMSVSGHLMFWFSEKHGQRTRELFAKGAPFLEFEQFPLVWHKTDNAGISARIGRSPRHVYETALLASRSKRPLVRVAADVYGSPTDKRLHPSCKPEPMLRHFFSMLCDSGTELLDPTCGSGSSLRAAESLGAKRVLGLERDENFARGAKLELERARKLRAAEAIQGAGLVMAQAREQAGIGK